MLKQELCMMATLHPVNEMLKPLNKGVIPAKALQLLQLVRNMSFIIEFE